MTSCRCSASAPTSTKSSGAPRCASWWRMGHLQPDSEAFGALKLTETARGVLKGETEVMLREETAGSRIRASRTKSRRGDIAPAIRRRGRSRRSKPARRAYGRGVRRWRASAACRPMSCCTTPRSTASRPSRPTTLGAAPRHPRHRRQEARALRRRADRAGEGRERAERGSATAAQVAVFGR